MKNLGLNAKVAYKKMINKQAKVFSPPKSGGLGLTFDLKVKLFFLAT